MDETTLTEFELRWLAYIGQAKRADALRNNRDHGSGPSNTAIDAANDIRGCKTEYATSIILNMYWRPHLGEYGKRDVGGLIDCRSTDLLDGRLIVKPADPDPVPFVLVIDNTPRFWLAGWMMAGQAKRFPLIEGFGDPAHFVAQRYLRPISELREWIHLQRQIVLPRDYPADHPVIGDLGTVPL